MNYVKKPDVSVLIAVYNQPRFLELILESLCKQSMQDFEIVLADDGSGPEIAQVIARYTSSFKYPVQHIWHEHQGFRKTIIANRAIRAARSDYLIFIDGDCIVHHRFIERHFQRRSIGQILSGRRVMLMPELTKKITSGQVNVQALESTVTWWNSCKRETRKFGKFRPGLFFLKNLYHRRYKIIGCNFSGFKGDILGINGYDERIIGRGLEDTNLCSRFKRAGFRIKSVATEALQYHLYHASDPIPHSLEVIREYGEPAYSWTPYGLVKKSL